MNRFPTLIKGTTRGEELSFKLSFVAIGPLVLALQRVQTDRRTDITCFGKLGKAQRLRLWERVGITRKIHSKRKSATHLSLQGSADLEVRVSVAGDLTDFLEGSRTLNTRTRLSFLRRHRLTLP